jgi:hypothetical protein
LNAEGLGRGFDVFSPKRQQLEDSKLVMAPEAFQSLFERVRPYGGAAGDAQPEPFGGIAVQLGGKEVSHRLDAEHAFIQAVQRKEKLMGAGHPIQEFGALEQIVDKKVVTAVVLQVERKDLAAGRSRWLLPVYPLKLGTLADARLPEQHGAPAARDGLKRESIGIEKSPMLAFWIGKEAVVIQDQMTVSGYPEACPTEVGK